MKVWNFFWTEAYGLDSLLLPLSRKLLVTHKNPMNKKLITVVSSALLAAVLLAEEANPQQRLSVDMGCRFDTEFVHRGSRIGRQVFRPKVKLSLTLFDGGEVYFGNRNWISRHSSPNWHDFYVGFSYAFADNLAADIGFTHRLWRDFESISATLMHEDLLPDGTRVTRVEVTHVQVNWIKESGVKDHSEEFYVGLKTDTFLNSSLYYSYNTTWHRHNLEGKANYSYDLSSWGFSGGALEFSSKIGYDRTQKPYGNKNYFSLVALSPVAPKIRKGYIYGGAGADLVYRFNEGASARIGVRYEGIQKKAWACSRINSGKSRRHLVWFTTELEGRF